MVNLNVQSWRGSFRPPPWHDVRWRAFLLLFIYLLMGMTTLGFSRQPAHIFILIGAGAIFDLVLSGLLRSRKIFPLSAMISCCSLAILLNWSYGMHNLWLPVYACIASKYLITLRGRHFFNPSLFAICVCILLGGEFVTLAPAYQWYGSSETAWMMGFFVVTGALFLFVFKINRTWLIGSFLVAFFAQTLLRAEVMEHIIPWETLFLSSVTSPAFYLFTFYMITDPATSPNKRSDQILVGVSIALLDLLFHLKFSLYTFFFAGLSVAAIRYFYFLGQQVFSDSDFSLWETVKSRAPVIIVLFLFFIPVFLAFQINQQTPNLPKEDLFELTSIPPSHSGLDWAPSNILNETDPRLAHVAKWVLSVGDAASVADVNGDGRPDIFLTQTLKHPDWRAKLYINKGDFQFEKVAIPDLEPYLDDPVNYGIPGFSFFLDYDNDGDKDLFVGFGFGQSRLFENRLIPDGEFSFEEVDVPFLQELNTICLSANAMDFNNDGYLDLFLANTLQTHFPDYDDREEPLNIFELPQPEYADDRRMYHFMHESWHNANNGGLNYLLLNTLDSAVFQPLDSRDIGIPETRWSLSVATLDINNDGYTDIYVANDFGRDDCYLNQEGRHFERQEGEFYGDIGLDTYKGMNASAGDLDGNGKDDIYISNVHHAMQAEGSLLWMNYTGDEAKTADFKESASLMNALNTNRFGWGAAFGDLNLNGWLDIVQANGLVGDSWDQKWEEAHDYWYYQAQIARTGPETHSYADKWADIRGCYIYPNEPDRIMLNNHGEGFFDLAEELGFDHLANTRGIALADFNNDGSLDILVTNQFGAPFLYRNEIKDHHWLGIELVGNGRSTNRDAVGSRVRIEYKLNGEPKRQDREMRLVNGFSAMGDPRLLFGLGHKSHTIEDIELVIDWHAGGTDRYPIDSINQYHTFKQSRGRADQFNFFLNNMNE